MIRLKQPSIGLLLLLLLVLSCGRNPKLSPSETLLHQGSCASAVPTGADSLTVVSYNVQYSEKIDQAIADLQADPRLREADIYLLQEMDPEGSAAMAQALGCNFVYYPASLHPHHDRLFGNAVLSRWPITDQRLILLPHGHPVTGDRRTATAAEIDVAGRSLLAVSVHIATIILPIDQRMEQATTVRDSIALIDVPIVIGGDFNTVTADERAAVRRVFRQAGFHEARLPEGSTLQWHILRLAGAELILDHILYRRLNLRCTGIGRHAEASDHLPVWATFDFAGPGGPG